MMLASSVLMSIGIGLYTTLQINTGHAAWIGYQVLAGAGVGLGFQQPLLAAQTVLPPSSISTGLAAVIFSQTMGGAIFVSVAQTAFTNKLVSSLRTHVPTLDPAVVLGSGAAGLREVVGKEWIGGVLLAYNEAVTRVFVVSLVMACLTVVGALGMEWRSVKEGKEKEKA